MHGGRPIDFRINLCEELGEKRVKELEAMRFQISKPPQSLLEEKIDLYTHSLKELEKKV
jgi:hypothetical protein